MRICTNCKESRSFDSFSKGCGSGGKRSQCKICDSKYRVKYKEDGRKAAYLRDYRSAGGKTSNDYILKNPINEMFYNSKTRAKQKGLEFNIEKSDIVIPSMCPVFGIPLLRGKHQPTNNSPSLDRRDNSKGYVKGNVYVISYKANSIKRDATVEDLEKIIEYMKN